MSEAGSASATTARSPARGMLLIVGGALLLNLGLLLFVQHYWHGDFPFQDEWGYVARLRRLPETGLLHYIFDRHLSYYLPVLFFFWYLSLSFTHLDIEVMRYAAVCVSTGVALLLAYLLYHRAVRRDRMLPWLLVYGIFVICALNHYYVYLQATEALVQPFLFGMVLCAVWAGERTLSGRHVALYTGLASLLALIGAGSYASGLSLLPALAAAQIFLLRRVNYPSTLWAVLGVLAIVLYVVGGNGLAHADQRPSGSLADLVQAVKMWIGLTGNALFTPHIPRLTILTYCMGLVLLAAQFCGLWYSLRQPAERRRALFIPVALTFYNNLVILEIIGTRLHTVESGLESSFTARYSILTLAGPVSVLFYGAMLDELVARLRRMAVAVFFGMVLATAASETTILVVLPHYAQVLARVRSQLLLLQGEPTPFQQTQMLLTPTMEPLVYPGKLYLQQEHLALYRDGAPPPSDP